MNKSKYPLLIFLILFLHSVAIHGANPYSYTFSITVYDVSLIRINPSTGFELKLLSTYAGESMASVSNNSTFLQLTSIPAAKKSRRIDARISSGSVPAGTKLTLYAIKESGKGECGIEEDEKTLSNNASETIINSIASGYTGKESQKGFRLVYTLKVNPDTYSQLRATSGTSVTVQYTIINNN